MHWRDRLGTMRSPIRATLHSPLFPAGANPFLSLFGSGAYKGVWFDPTDLTTIYTDRAGTMLATMPGLGSAVTIGKWLDKSGGGNHMSVSADSKRPTLSARVNLLTYSEQFDNAAWTKSGVTVSANSTTAPDGTATADKIVEDSATSSHQINQAATTTATTYVFAAYVKPAGRNWAVLAITDSGSVTRLTYFNVASGTIGTIATGITAVITSAGSGWYLCSVSVAAALAGTNTCRIYASTGDGVASYAGDGTSGIYVWGANLRRPCDAIAGIPAYQRVVDALTYDTTGFPLFALFDGVDDSGQTPSIDFSGTDKMTVFAGVTVLADSVTEYLVELSASYANAGCFMVNVRGLAANDRGFGLTGTTGGEYYAPGGYTTPASTVLSCAYDIAGAARVDEIIPRVNGVLAQTNGGGTANAGTGNFSNNILNIGARNNAGSFFNGRLYHLVAVGRACSAGEITAAESAINAKMGRVY